ncbi:class I SAM-dependent methyltransferase [Shimia aestuarii]|uniref:class I SAM-dependent methyltransferase n=1 Tax=Shimia aestuarii TaxID=254406 RepID=UPI001FB4694A|nr:class I SAM-dependent methyltransferase [Shimia aestuarii]
MGILNRLFYKNRKFYDDDFDWDNYTADSYERRVKGDIETKHHANAGQDELSYDTVTGKVTVRSGSLHANHLLILEAIGQLQPDSVHEVGCGGGDHVAHADKLYPSIRVTGSDRGASQLDLAKRRHPDLEGKLGLQDITMPFSSQWPQAELVYSQAVLMHIHTAVSHLVGLSNMTRMASKYVLLMENYQCHNFIGDIQALWNGGHIPWESLNIHRFNGSTGARAILLSKQKLDMPVVTSDEEIRDGLVPSQRRLKRSDEDSSRGIFGY